MGQLLLHTFSSPFKVSLKSNLRCCRHYPSFHVLNHKLYYVVNLLFPGIILQHDPHRLVVRMQWSRAVSAELSPVHHHLGRLLSILLAG